MGRKYREIEYPTADGHFITNIPAHGGRARWAISAGVTRGVGELLGERPYYLALMVWMHRDEYRWLFHVISLIIQPRWVH